jgi:hypothetical protein
MAYSDLRDFIAQLENRTELKRIPAEVSPKLEITELCARAGRRCCSSGRAATPSRCSQTCSARWIASLRRWARRTLRRCAESASCSPT